MAIQTRSITKYLARPTRNRKRTQKFSYEADYFQVTRQRKDDPTFHKPKNADGAGPKTKKLPTHLREKQILWSLDLF